MIDYLSIPELPGCYLFSDGKDTIIYAGKAKNLKRRVSSYFTKKGHDSKTEMMVSEIAGLDYIITATETEALILENTLIKRHKPRFNIDLKDSKNFAYIHMSDDEYPRIGISRKKAGRGMWFGPFVSARERDYVLSLVKKTFGLRSCGRMPKRPCLRYHMGTCAAPCIGGISAEDYGERVRLAESVLKGNVKELITVLKVRMDEKAAQRDYEAAITMRDQIAAISHLEDRQNVDREKKTDEDIIHWIPRGGRVYLLVFSVHRGTLSDKKEYTFDENEDAVQEFLVQYYSEYEPPSELILPIIPDEALVGFLSEVKGKKVKITVPKKGSKKDLLDLAERNIEALFFGGEMKMNALEKRLRLPEPPAVIECFDISHFGGDEMVGSMVQFRYGRPDKSNYRRYRIRTVEGIDDYAAIGEVVRRRYTRLFREGAEYPDLIVIDGGKGQLSAAEKTLSQIGVEIPVISIAKREEEIFVPGFSHPLPIKKNEKASLFVQEMRDEAHRFAVTYNRLLRRKKVKE